MKLLFLLVLLVSCQPIPVPDMNEKCRNSCRFGVSHFSVQEGTCYCNSPHAYGCVVRQ